MLVAVLGDDAPACLDAAIAKIDHDLRPVPRDTEGRKAWETALDERLRRLAVKVLPTASVAQTQPWREALAEALSDLPAMVSLTAAKRAVHRPFRFIGDIEPAVREIAAEVIDDRERTRAAMRRHREAVERAARPQPALPAAEPDRQPTPEEVEALNGFMRRAGCSTRFGADGETYQVDPADEVEAQAA